MTVDLKAIEEKIRKLTILKELASDPEMASMLSEFMGKNGVAPKAKANANNGASRIIYAEKAARSMGHNKFTTNDLTAKMIEMGYAFTAKDHLVATYGAMLLLKDKGIIEVSEKGGPGKLAKWVLK